jgi:hypothetical protein
MKNGCAIAVKYASLKTPNVDDNLSEEEKPTTVTRLLLLLSSLYHKDSKLKKHNLQGCQRPIWIIWSLVAKNLVLFNQLNKIHKIFANSLNNLYLCRGNGFLSKVSSDFGTTHFVFMLILFLAEPVF